MAFDSGSTLQQTDQVSSVTATAPTGGGGGVVSNWNELTGELSGPVPFDATDSDGNPTSRSLQFLNVTPQVDVTSDPANGIALEIKDQTNGNRLGTLTTDGRWETRGDMEAFADGSFGSGSSTNSLLQVEDAGTVLTTDAASLNFKGSGVSLTQSGNEITVDVSGGSSVGSLSDLSDVSSATQSDGNVLASDGTSYSEETAQTLFDAHISVSASDVSGVSADSVADAHHNQDQSANYKDGGSFEIDAAEFAAGGGTSGQVLQSDGAAASWATLSAGDVSGISAHTRPSAGDGLSDSSNTFSVNESQVDHDSLNQFVANEHVDHSAVTIGAGTALSGGGDLTASRTLNVAGPLTGIPFKTDGDDLEWQADSNDDLILQNTTDSQTLLKVDQDTGTVFAAGDVVAFGLSGGGGSGSTSGLQADAPLTLDTSTDPDTIGLSVGSGLTVNSGTLEADGSVGVSSVFGRTGDVTASSGDYSHGQISGISSDDHHTRYSDEEAQDAVGTILTDSGAATVTYDDAANTITVSATDTNTQLSDSEVQTAINNDSDHGSTASHNYTTSASRLSDVSPDSDADAHHAVFEPADYTPVSDVEAHGSALAIDITGNADTLDGVEGSNYARTDVNETFNNDVYVSGGNVGIGTTSPDANLDVLGASSGNGDAIAFFSGGGGNPRWKFFDEDTGANDGPRILGSAENPSIFSANGPIHLSSNYDSAPGGDLAINRSGNVGIGATSPSYSLDVNGAIQGKALRLPRAGDGIVFTSGYDGPDRASIESTGDPEFNDLAFYTGAGDLTMWLASGNQYVGIGGINSPSYVLEVSGDARATGEVEAFLGSDRRLKTGLDPLDSALDKVDQLTGYGFDWRGADAVQPHKRGKTDVGLIAQEVEGVLPEAVKTFTDGHSEGYKSVSYDKLVPLLVEAIKDLRSQVNNLQ